MKRITKTRELAHAAGWDAGNASMKRGHREHWNEEDYNAACETMNRLWPDVYWDGEPIPAHLVPKLPRIAS